jgi:hypothetical protein
MFERSENLALVTESTDDEVRVHPALDELDRDALLELTIGTFCEIDGTHASASDLAGQLVDTDLFAEEVVAVAV